MIQFDESAPDRPARSHTGCATQLLELSVRATVETAVGGGECGRSGFASTPARFVVRLRLPSQPQAFGSIVEIRRRSRSVHHCNDTRLFFSSYFFRHVRRFLRATPGITFRDLSL